MRMSDWSSDVCSSDLRDAGGDGVRQRAGNGGLRLLVVEVADRQFGAPFEIEGRLVGRDVDRARRGVLAVERALRAAQHFDLGDVQDVEGRGGDAAAIDRSEEHTSELQSLMRISY